MKTIWLLGLGAVLLAMAYSRFAPTLSQAAPAPAPDQPVTSPVPAALEPAISLYLFLHHARPGNNPVHAMAAAATCSD